MFENLITEKAAPPNRMGKHDGEFERHFPEAAVMLAFAFYLLKTEDVRFLRLCPDGEHGKQFDITGWLKEQGFALEKPVGKTKYGGGYLHQNGAQIDVTLTPGIGDVVAVLNSGAKIVAECKGGIINTKHPGQVSKLRKGLCEAVGLLMASEVQGRQIAVVPKTAAAVRLGERMKERCSKAGIEIAFVEADGAVQFL